MFFLFIDLKVVILLWSKHQFPEKSSDFISSFLELKQLKIFSVSFLFTVKITHKHYLTIPRVMAIQK